MPAHEIVEQDLRFLRKRTRLVKTWPVIGAVLFLSVAAAAAVLFHRAPLMVNPFHFEAALAEGLLPAVAVESMAAMLPVAFLMVFLLLEAMVIFGFSAFFNERRLLRIVEALRDGED